MQNQQLFKLAIGLLFAAFAMVGSVQARTEVSNGNFLIPAVESKAIFAASGDWEIRSKRVDVGFIKYIRFNRVTGESFICANDEWVKIIEPAPVARGEYDIQLNGEAGDKFWSAIRIEKATGKCWFLIGDAWKFVPDKKP